MGLGFGISRSSYDDNSACGCGDARVGTTFSVTNFKILQWKEIGSYLLVKIQYPDCKNYEGNKVLLYQNCTLDKLLRQPSIDPHFSDNKNFLSPIARFEPTEAGWSMGASIAEMYSAANRVFGNDCQIV